MKEPQSVNFRERFPSPNLIYRNDLIKRTLSKYNMRGKKILEVGCGTGGLLYSLRGIDASITGLDADKNACERARKRCAGTNINIIHGDLSKLSNKYHFILLFDVLEHIEDDKGFLSELLTFLDDDEGYLLLTVPGNKKLYGKKDMAHGHYRRYEKNELTDKLQQAGYEVTSFFSWGVKLLALLNRLFVAKIKETPNLQDQTLKSSYNAPKSSLLQFLHPIYSRFPFLLRFQDPFLKTKFMNCHFLCISRPKK